MKIIIVKDYEEMSRRAADVFKDTIKKNANCVIGLATGDTPIGLYDCLVEDYRSGELDFSGVSSVNLDEYYPLSPENPQSYRYFMNKYLFSRTNFDIARTFVPNGEAEDVDASCREYDAIIEDLGGIDVQVLGIGRNGHIGFNEPEDGLYLDTHITSLTQNTIQANSRFFDRLSDVPTKAITMGMRSIFRAKKLVILASGEGKAEAVARLASGRIGTDCPASLLLIHPDVTLICDKEAASGLECGDSVGETVI